MPDIHKHQSSFVLMYNDFPNLTSLLAHSKDWAFREYTQWRDPNVASSGLFIADDEAYMLLLCMLDTIGPYDSDIPNETRD